MRRSFPIQLLGILVASGLAGSSWAAEIKLKFPLPFIGGTAKTPYNATISSVFDHALSDTATGFYCAGQNAWVLAYTGEKANGDAGSSLGFTCMLRGFKHSAVSVKRFFVNGNFSDSACPLANQTCREELSYDGHSGYDYPASVGTSVFAAAPGIVSFIGEGTGNCANLGKCVWISHGTLTTIYGHLSQVDVVPRQSVFPYPSPKIGSSGDTGFVTGPHLHFEVRRGTQWVDPYGWAWFNGPVPEGDPIYKHPFASEQVEPLWDVIVPTITGVSLTTVSGGVEATISGTNFAAGSFLQLWNVDQQSWDRKIAPSSSSATEITANLQVGSAPPERFAVTVKHPDGPGSRVYRLRSPTFAASSNPLSIGGDAADGGGTFLSYAFLNHLSDASRLIFSASVDLNGDGVSDKDGVWEQENGAIREVTNPAGGVGFGAIRMNSVGDLAFFDQATSGGPRRLHLLRNGQSTPTEIARVGQTIEQTTGWPVTSFQGMNLADNGSTVVTADLTDWAHGVSYCCVLLVFSSTGQQLGIVRGTGSTSGFGGNYDGETTPLGGPLKFSNASPQFTSDGDVTFMGQIANGSGDQGIFRFDLGSGVSVVVARNNPAPFLGGTFAGTFAAPAYAPLHAIAGDWLTFTSVINGTGSTKQGIYRKNLVSGAMNLVAYQGQATGTEAGGTFSIPGNPGANAPFTEGPHLGTMRADGAVIFHSRLNGALSTGGAPTYDGIFLWTGAGFRKVVTTGDPTATGGTIKPPGNFINNDVGKIVFLQNKN